MVCCEDINGETALSLSIKNHCAELTEQLLRHGADLRLRNTHNETPGSICMQSIHKDLLPVVAQFAPAKEDKGPLEW